MIVLKVLLLSLRLYAAEPEYEEPPTEPEVIHIEFHYLQKLSIGEVIVSPYEDIEPTPQYSDPFLPPAFIVTETDPED